MRVWNASIHQVRKDASGNIHVNLDSSTPCWNDTSKGGLLKLIEAASLGIFKEDGDRRDRNIFP